MACKALVSVTILVASFITRVEPLTCLQCNNVPQPRHCDTVSKCQNDEICGVEEVTNDFGDVLYNVGCMKTSKCWSSNHTSHCMECCTSDLCNDKGCGETGYPQSRGPVCYNCPVHTTEKICHKIDICAVGEICMIDARREFGDLVLSSSCSDVHACKQGMVSGTEIVGRSLDHVRSGYEAETRSLREHLCHECCDSDLCNTNCNRSTTQRPCDSNPCVHGQCHEVGDGFLCQCYHGYSGKHCDVAISACQSNPCVHGKCIDGGANGFLCHCSLGYAGRRCEKPAPRDCDDIHRMNSSARSGVYVISPWKSHTKIEVLCDMDTDNGGWTVFQRRFNGSVNFSRNFAEYENGFGNLVGEFWLGLKYIKEMSWLEVSELRIDLTSANGSRAYELFRNFSLGEAPRYTLYIEHGIGTAGDADGLSYSKNTDFATVDRNDRNGCARKSHSGWWFASCSFTNLNAIYVTPGTWVTDAGFEYYSWQRGNALRESKMMFRRMHM